VHGDSEQKSTPGSAKKPSATASKAGSKKSQRKDDEWEEVSRKYVSSCVMYLCCL